jgi:hypothetical protein
MPCMLSAAESASCCTVNHDHIVFAPGPQKATTTVLGSGGPGKEPVGVFAATIGRMQFMVAVFRHH